MTDLPLFLLTRLVCHSPMRQGVNYTYYITRQKNVARNTTEIITHRIDFDAGPLSPAAHGHILYGDFKVQYDIPEFRKAFYPPDVCNPNGGAMPCGNDKVREWNMKYFKHRAARRGWL